MLKNQFMRFLLVGGFSAAVNFFSRIGYSHFMTFRFAIVAAYVTGMVTAYILMRWLVFNASGKHPAREFYYFTLVNLVAIVQVWLVSVGLAEHLFPRLSMSFYPQEVAHFVGICVPVVSSYVGHKYLSFGPNRGAT